VFGGLGHSLAYAAFGWSKGAGPHARQECTESALALATFFRSESPWTSLPGGEDRLTTAFFKAPVLERSVASGSVESASRSPSEF
jgi:hypothetical protein